MEKTLTEVQGAAWAYFTSNNEMLPLVGVLVVVVLLIGYTLHKGKKVPGEDKMTKREEYLLNKRQRRLKQKAWLSDCVADMLLVGYTQGVLDEQEYELWHLRFGKRLALYDLLPKKLTPQQTKEAVKKRRSSDFYKKVVPLPKVKETKQKTVIDNILAA